jgi:hypothetical protein
LNENSNAFGFADDIIIIQEGKEKLLENIRKIENWCIINKAKLNKDKSGIQILKWKYQRKNEKEEK